MASVLVTNVVSDSTSGVGVSTSAVGLTYSVGGPFYVKRYQQVKLCS